MTTRRAFVVTAMVNLLIASGISAQEPAKHYRLGIISAGNNPRSAAFYAAFEQRLRELGWIDGKNLSIDFEASESPEELSAIATRMARRGADVILAAGPEAALKAASESTQTIPIVIVALNYDPVEKGYVASLARPGRNITGVFFRNPEVGPKQLELLHQAIPGANRVGILWTAFSADQIPPLDAEASRLRVRLEKVVLASPYDIDATFATLKARRVDAVLAIGDPIVYRERVRIAELALERRLPVVGGLPGVEVGNLMGFGPGLNAALARGAEYVDKILRGAKPGDLPVELPTRYELVFNLATAKALRLEIPTKLLALADEVIQ